MRANLPIWMGCDGAATQVAGMQIRLICPPAARRGSWRGHNARLAAHRYLLPLLRVDTYAPVQLLRREVHGAGHGLDACSMKWFAAGSTILGQIPGIAANLLPERLKRLEREGAAGGPALLRSAAAV